MKNTFCTASCRHLRSRYYGFDGSVILAAYNGKDRLATCAMRPNITIHTRSLPTCFVEKERP